MQTPTRKWAFIRRLFTDNALESAAPATSALTPWNTCGVFIYATLNVATSEYLPYAIFNIAMPEQS